MSKRLVLSCTSSDENFDGGCQFAFVDMTPEFAALALERLELCRTLHEEDRDLVEMYFWSSAAVFFGNNSDTGLCIEDIAPSLAEALDPISDWKSETYGEACQITADVPEELHASIECLQMVVDYDGHIHFSVIPKHSSVYVTTKYISKKMLEEALEVKS